MKIISSAFEDKQLLPEKYTCVEKGVTPPLQFSEIPVNAKSLALILDDPDAVGGNFAHWVVYNIPVNVSEFAENTKPSGVEGVNSGGRSGYYPPCPPSGTGVHRYTFKLYALDTEMNLSGSVDKKAVENAMQGHILDQAELVGLFGK